MQPLDPQQMKDSYFLKTSRLGFRNWSESDQALANALWGDAEVTRLIGGPFSQAQIDARLNQEIVTYHLSGLQYWPIFLLSSNENVGCCGLRPFQDNEKIAEIGFHLCKAHWGKGYASEAALNIMKYAFDKLRLDALFAGHNPQNESSRALLHKLGFRYVRDEFYQPTGLMHPSYLITAKEFALMREDNP